MVGEEITVGHKGQAYRFCSGDGGKGRDWLDRASGARCLEGGWAIAVAVNERNL